MDKLKICHLYPDLLNLYGDRGNIIAMNKRLKWRGIGFELDSVSVGDKFYEKQYDIVFIGGGQDFDQAVLLADLTKEKVKSIKAAVQSDVTFLAICGGYQLLGSYYRGWDGVQYDFTDAIDVYTVGQKKRMIGNYAFTCHDKDISDLVVVGFENHSGKTFLGKSVNPMGTVVKGFGNNGEDKTAGARYKNVFGCYSHGPLLPKNPRLCDYILETALKRKYGDYKLNPLNNVLEDNACSVIVKRIK